VDFNSVNVGFS